MNFPGKTIGVFAFISLLLCIFMHVSSLSADDDFDFDFSAIEAEFEKPSTASGRESKYMPLTVYNKFIFSLNDTLFRLLIKPLAIGYSWIVPEPGQKAIQRFFVNLEFPKRGLNNLLQGKFRRAGVETARFGINSTVGIGGLFDPANKYFNLEQYDEDFGQTLGWYGSGSGPYIVWPVIGPSNLRDTVGLAVDTLTDPFRAWVKIDPAKDWQYYNRYNNSLRIGYGVKRLNLASLYLEEYEKLYDDALDPYVFFRDAYAQRRDAQIKD